MTPSLGVGGSTNTRRSRTAWAWSVTRGPLMHFPAVAFVDGHAGQHATELTQRLANDDAAVDESELTNRPLVFAATLLHDREGLTGFAARFEVANQHYGVGQIGRINRRGHLRANESGVSADEDRRDVPLTQIGQQLVELHGQEPLLRDRVEVSVQTVDHDQLDLVAFDGLANGVRQLTRRELRRIDLSEVDEPALSGGRDVDAETSGPGDQRDRTFIEDVECRFLSAPGGRGSELQRERRFSSAGRPDDQRAGPLLEAATEQRIDLGNAAFHSEASGRGTVLGGNQTRIDLDAALSDGVVVVSAAKRHTAVLANSEPAAIGAVFGIHLLEDDHAVRDALDAGVVISGRQVVEQHHRAAAPVEVLLQREDLTPVAERASRQQP